MKNIYILGTPNSGKTSIALGLALKLRQEGRKVAYFKPVGSYAGSTSFRGDEDALLMKEILEMEHPLETIVPYIAGPSYLSSHSDPSVSLNKVRRAYESIAGNSDIIIIGGAGYPHIMGSLGLDAMSLALELQAMPLYIIRIDNDYSLDQTIFINRYMSCNDTPVFGNIFYNVPRSLLAKTEGIYKPTLQRLGYRILGLVPGMPDITSPTVKEYYEVLGGEVLAGEDRMEQIVEDIVIVAMTAESALDYLRRGANKGVITGGDRSEIALAALETNTSMIVLTGSLYPDVKLIARAEGQGVPLILVHYDTYTTIEKMSAVSRKITAGDKKAIKTAVDNIDQYVEWKGILNALQ